MCNRVFFTYYICISMQFQISFVALIKLVLFTKKAICFFEHFEPPSIKFSDQIISIRWTDFKHDTVLSFSSSVLPLSMHQSALQILTFSLLRNTLLKPLLKWLYIQTVRMLQAAQLPPRHLTSTKKFNGLQEEGATCTVTSHQIYSFRV